MILKLIIFSYHLTKQQRSLSAQLRSWLKLEGVSCLFNDIKTNIDLVHMDDARNWRNSIL